MISVCGAAGAAAIRAARRNRAAALRGEPVAVREIPRWLARALAAFVALCLAVIAAALAMVAVSVGG